MDVRQKNTFYRRASFLCGLFCFLLLPLANLHAASEPVEQLVEKPVLHPKGLFWKLQKTGQPDSYLFGTMHLADSRVVALIDVVQEQLNKVDVFAMEILLDPDGQQKLAEATFFQNGELLQDFIDDVKLDRINTIMAQYYGVPESVVNRMQPWALMATISSPPPESNHSVLDVQLQQRAVDAGREVVGLETVDEQIAALSGMSFSEQLWMLGKSVADFERSMGLWESLINNYLERDLARLVNEQEQLMDASTDIDDRFMNALLDQRNVKMAKRMHAIMQKKSLFAAIGALHLPGKNGVLHLLEKQGYTVTPLY